MTNAQAQSKYPVAMNHPEILNASEIYPGDEATKPYRFVLRRINDQYVVHMQTLDDDGFHNGDYYEGNVSGLLKAAEKFIERSESKGLNPEG